MMKLQHIAIIPDGNRRWAKKRGLPSFFGHREGVKTAEKIFKTALALNIPYVTAWAASVSNVTERSRAEVAFLSKLFELYFKKLAKEKLVHENGVRVRALGRWKELFPEKLQSAVRGVIEKTKHYKNYNLTILLAYDGRDEMMEAISRLRQGFDGQVKINPPAGGQKSKLPITADDIKQHLWTKDLPPVDLVIRTGGEPHWSAGFMMWDVADAQLHFTETLWPAFSEKEFRSIVAEYGNRERRMGK